MLCEKCYNAVISKTLGEPENKMSFGNFWNPWLKLRKEVFEGSQLKSIGFLLS